MKSVIFFHRSVGHNLIHDGDLYGLAQKSGNFTLSDYDQNTDTLTDSMGKQSHPGFRFPSGNTRPADFAAIFTEDVADTYRPIQELALSFDVVVLKSCYPNTSIKDDQELAAIQGYYQKIAAFFAARPDKKLVLLTSPPLVPLMTKPDRAGRARQLADWLSSTPLGDNVTVFNFFDLLAEPEGAKHAGVLRRRYRRWLPFDSHPNVKASQEIAPQLAAVLSRC